MNALVEIIEPTIVVRQRSNGAPVFDRERIDWREGGEVVAIEAEYAERVRRTDVRFYATVAFGLGFLTGVLFALIEHAGLL